MAEYPRDPAFLRWVHERGACLVCRRRGPDAAHLQTKTRFGDVGNVLGLCRTHHSAQHVLGWARFSAMFSVNPWMEAGRLAQAWDRLPAETRALYDREGELAWGA